VPSLARIRGKTVGGEVIWRKYDDTHPHR